MEIIVCDYLADGPAPLFRAFDGTGWLSSYPRVLFLAVRPWGTSVSPTCTYNAYIGLP